MKKRFVQTIRQTGSGKQVVMFPFGGGSGYSYMELINLLDKDIEVLTINPPGHLMNGGIPVETITEMVALYVPELRLLLKPEVLFFGHSIGGLVAYESIKALQSDRSVKRLVLSSVNPPHSVLHKVDLRSDMDKQVLVDRCERLGGLPQVFRDEPDLLDLFLIGLRADLKALEHYTAPQDPSPLPDCSATYLYSSDDSILDTGTIREWEQYITCKEYIPFTGEHFYLFLPDNRQKVAEILNQRAALKVE